MSLKKFLHKTDQDQFPSTLQVDDIDCKTLRCESPLAVNYKGYALIEKDLNKCMECLEKLEHLSETDPNDIIKWSLYVAFIVTYGKCFATAEGRRVKLEKDHLPPEGLHFHETLMELRNKYIAHGGGHGEGGIVLIGLNPSETDKKVLGVSPPLVLHVSTITPEYITNFKVLLRHHLRKTDELKLSKKKALDEWVDKQDINEMYKILE